MSEFDDGEEAFERAMRQIARAAPPPKDDADEDYAVAQATQLATNAPRNPSDENLPPMIDFEGID